MRPANRKALALAFAVVCLVESTIARLDLVPATLHDPPLAVHPGGDLEADSSELAQSFLRKMTWAEGPTLFLQDQGDAGDGMRNWKATIVGVIRVTDPACAGMDADTCFNTAICREGSGQRRLLQRPTISRAVATIIEAIITRVLVSRGVPARTARMLARIIVSALFNISGRRRDLLVAPGDELYQFTTEILGTGTEENAKIAYQAVVDGFNNGEMNTCRGWDFKPDSTKPPINQQIRPVQRYIAQVVVVTRGRSCERFNNKARRAWRLCTASLTGRPGAFVDVSCAPDPRVPNRFAITIQVPQTEVYDVAKALFDGLVADVQDGSLATCIRANGVNRYRPIRVRSSQLFVPNPQLSGN